MVAQKSRHRQSRAQKGSLGISLGTSKRDVAGDNDKLTKSKEKITTSNDWAVNGRTQQYAKQEPTKSTTRKELQGSMGSDG